MKTHEKLVCINTGEEFIDDGLMLANPNTDKPAFLRAKYFADKLTVRNDLPGLYKFAEWLPIRKTLEGSSAPVTYKSKGLAKKLGLSNLYITFSGYWPEKDALMMTGSFKECEAYSVCARMPEDTGKVLVVASAGNTARAFIRVCSENNIPLVVFVPEPNLNALWFEKEIKPCVKLIAAGGNSDYSDAIYLSQLACQVNGFMPEGGAKNVARRDGMGTTVLSAVTTIGEIPDYYFQAVGSGTGAIAAWEANLRFIESGEYGDKKISLQVSQNTPFLPIHDSWKARSRDLIISDDKTCHDQIDEVWAKVLTNRKPPYGLIGGLFDALKDSNGDTIAITNEEAKAAKELFTELEGNDPSPAASVAVASMIKKVESGEVDKDAIIMVNITGGGFERLQREKNMTYLKPAATIGQDEMNLETVKNTLNKLF